MKPVEATASSRGAKDTSSSVTARYRNMIMERKPVDRLLMGFSMYDAAKQIVKTAILDEHPGISPEEMRKELFLRFYGGDQAP